MIDKGNKIRNEGARISHDIGELNGEKVMENILCKGCEVLQHRLPNKAPGGNGQLDGIRLKEDGTVVMAEYKGGESPLGTRLHNEMSYEQATPGNVVLVVQEYIKYASGDAIKHLPKNERDEIKKTVRKVEFAIENDMVEFHVIRQRFTQDDQLGNTVITPTDMSDISKVKGTLFPELKD